MLFLELAMIDFIIGGLKMKIEHGVTKKLVGEYERVSLNKGDLFLYGNEREFNLELNVGTSLLWLSLHNNEVFMELEKLLNSFECQENVQYYKWENDED